MAKHAKAPKAFVNVRNVGFAGIESMTDRQTKYAEALLTRGLKTISSESSGEPKVAYADGMEIESGRNNGQRTISLVMHAFGPEVRALLFGDEPDTDGVVAEKRNAVIPEVAFWFKHERKDGTFKLYGYPRVIFNEPAMEGSQEEDDYDWTEETSEGIAMWRLDDEARRFTYDSATDKGSVEAFLRKLLGPDYEITDIVANLTTGSDETVTDGTETAPETP